MWYNFLHSVNKFDQALSLIIIKLNPMGRVAWQTRPTRTVTDETLLITKVSKFLIIRKNKADQMSNLHLLKNTRRFIFKLRLGIRTCHVSSLHGDNIPNVQSLFVYLKLKDCTGYIF